MRDSVKRKQNLLYGSAVIVVALAVGLIAYLLIDEEPEVHRPKPRKNVEIPTDSINPQAILNDRVESEMELMKARFSAMESIILEKKKKEELAQRENQQLRNEIEKLKSDLQNREMFASFDQKIRSSQENIKINEPELPFNDSYFQSFSNEEPRQGIVVKVAEPKTEMIKNVETTIPSGTTVKAVLVSSVDAPCGVYSSSDPQPVKLQILDDGHLPKKVRAKLKGGIVIASAYGDLSSERLYIRVERLTQVKPTGDFVDTTITGFVTGEDGKYGVRGTVVDKSTKLIGNAAMAGVLSGVNNFFQAYSSRYTGCYGPYGGGYCCDDKDISGKEFTYGLMAQGGTAGLDNAFNALTDFYIRRAELIKPVLQVNAGRIVDLTFSISTDIGDIHARDKVEKIRTEARRA